MKIPNSMAGLLLPCGAADQSRTCSSEGNTGWAKMQRVPVMGTASIPGSASHSELVIADDRRARPCETIADRAPRPGRATTAPGLGRRRDLHHPRRGGGRGRRAGPPGWPAERRPGPFHVAVLLDNVPELRLLARGGGPGRGGGGRGATPPTGATNWPATSPTPSASCWSPTGPSCPSSTASTSAAASGRCRSDSDRVVGGRRPRRGPPPRPFAGPRPRPRAPSGSGPDSLGYLLFTSGTSGAPKACRCTQGRLARIGAIVAQMFGLTADDVCYLSMPLFHSNALMAGLGARPGRRGHLGPAHRRAVLGLGVPARRPAARRHLLQLRRQAPGLHPGHARTARRRRQPAACGPSGTRERPTT